MYFNHISLELQEISEWGPKDADQPEGRNWKGESELTTGALWWSVLNQVCWLAISLFICWVLSNREEEMPMQQTAWAES